MRKIRNFNKITLEEIEEIIDKSSNIISQFTVADIFLESSSSESITIQNGVVKNRGNSSDSGYAVRGVNKSKDILFTYGDLDIEHINKDVKALAKFGYMEPQNINCKIFERQDLYYDFDYFDKNEEMLNEAENYIRERCTYIENITVTGSYSKQETFVFNNLGNIVYDRRPKFRILFNVVASKNGNTNNYYDYYLSRKSCEDVFNNWKKTADQMIETIEKTIDSKDSVSGTYPVVFASGKPGTLIHEAVGHSLEGDFNRQENSVFSGMMHKSIASENVRIVDDGTLGFLNGSIHFDDEGMPSQRNILVENGILQQYMSGRKDGELLGTGTTGNGRRQNYTTQPIPRMTNTYLEATNKNNIASLNEMLNTYNKCVYVVGVSHGAVDITSGQFSFTCNEAYLVENGIHTPLKDCVFSGMGAKVLKSIEKIGHSIDLDPGTCGKSGSWVPVTCGQTALLVSEITLG